MFDFTDGERKGKVKIVEQVKFLEEVLFRIGDYLPEEVEWEITSVRKNNNQRLDGLIIKREEENVSPILYLQPYYEKYMEGEELDDVIQEIMWQWEKEREIAIEPIELFDFEACREQLFFRLVNFSLNDELWERTPYVPWVDLALTVRWLWEEETDGIRSILIRFNEWRLYIPEMLAVWVGIRFFLLCLQRDGLHQLIVYFGIGNVFLILSCQLIESAGRVHLDIH